MTNENLYLVQHRTEANGGTSIRTYDVPYDGLPKARKALLGYAQKEGGKVTITDGKVLVVTATAKHTFEAIPAIPA